MRGFPKWVNTPQDLVNLEKEYPEQTKAYKETLRAERYTWQAIDSKDYQEDFDHRMVEEGLEEETTVYLRKVADVNARYYSLGIDKEDADGRAS